MNDIVAELLKKFADRDETAMKLRIHDKHVIIIIVNHQINRLYSLLNTERKQEEDEAMLSKKPLLGYSCGSCDKNLVNYYGLKGDFVPWNKMP
jgi:hypothetical protein